MCGKDIGGIYIFSSLNPNLLILLGVSIHLTETWHFITVDFNLKINKTMDILLSLLMTFFKTKVKRYIFKMMAFLLLS